MYIIMMIVGFNPAGKQIVWFHRTDNLNEGLRSMQDHSYYILGVYDNPRYKHTLEEVEVEHIVKVEDDNEPELVEDFLEVDDIILAKSTHGLCDD